eukprot:m.51263 g.51263  ORF g.51263 m.51263 type:complete len:175 (+) comp6597_c0_seq2:722-1246(+)
MAPSASRLRGRGILQRGASSGGKALLPRCSQQTHAAQIAELKNGSVIINMRNSHLDPGHCNCRGIAISHDGGETWSSVYWAPELIEPVCSAGLINHAGSLYFSNPHSTHTRANMTVMVSHDDGAHWAVLETVWPLAAAYSVLVPLDDTTIAVVYERGQKGPYEFVTFHPLNVGP